MSDFRQEFIVTLKNYNELENFYLDMETEGTTKSFIPSAAIPCVDRRPVSRNTHYLLTRHEARELIKDERVQSVELRLKDPSIKIEPHATQTGDWSRGDNISVGNKNWGLYRSLVTENEAQWGSDVILNSTITRDITLDATGKNVDIIIVDDTVWPDHAEFGERFVQYDWFGQHDAAVRGTGCVITHISRSGTTATITTQTAHNINPGAVINVVCTTDSSFTATGVTVTAVGVTSIGNGGDGLTVNTISYTTVTSGNVARTTGEGFWRGVYQYTEFSQENNHATHVAAIAAGNTQGWARDANIYNLKHNAIGVDAETSIPNDLIFNYIKEFHNNKSINPETGRKNPTIVNNSWGLGITLYTRRNPYTGTSSYDFPKINYRGADITPTTSPVDTGISGIFTSNALIAGLSSVAPGTACTIQTTGIETGTVTTTTYSPNGRTGLTQVAPTFVNSGVSVSENDEAYWQLSIPFGISYCTQTYNTGSVYVSSNSHITFGGPSNALSFGATNPAIRKIFVSTGDRSCENLWTGTFGTTGSRTFIVRWEGYEGAYSTTYETTPTTVWEMKFFEATNNTFELQIVSNANYRGEFTDFEILSRGLSINELGPSPIRSTAIDADISDTIDAGVIFVGSAGNAGLKIDNQGGLDYDNYVIDNGLPLYYQRGSSPAASHPDAICVGSIDSASTETKAQTSNTGPRVDIYAPGRNITSAVYDNTGIAADIVGDALITTAQSAARSSGVVTIVTSADHNLTTGDIVTTEFNVITQFNVSNVQVTVVDQTTFSYAQTGTDVTTTSVTGEIHKGYLYQKRSGTSMACAQVTGILALALETYPNMTPAEAKAFVTKFARSNLLDTGGSYDDNTSLQGSANRFAYYRKERPDNGVLIPKNVRYIRPDSGLMYPRPLIKKK